jgi:chorismate synthase
MGVRYVTAGESHGKALVAILEGIPAGITVSTDDIRQELARRRSGVGRGERQKFEQDDVTILSGVLQGRTIASPIAIEIQNSEWGKWQEIMSPDFNDCGDLPAPNVPAGEELDKLLRPRPGHADFEGIRKYGFSNARPVLERASARETAARVAVGTIAKAYLNQLSGTQIHAQVTQFGKLRRSLSQSDAEFDALGLKVADEAVQAGETIGGVVEIRAVNVPPGLGSYISADQRLDAKLASALMSIPAVKAVEIGDGFAVTELLGSQAHDAIYCSDTELQTNSSSSDNSVELKRRTNHAGGIEGGISNGEELVLRIAIKPIPSVPGGLETVNLATLEPSQGHSQRSDCSAVYPARIVAEAMVALVLADVATNRYGHDQLSVLNN